MAEINAEYDVMFNRLKNAHNANTTDESKKTTETPEEFKNIIEKLMKLYGLEVEICGSWLWITGDTFTNKDALKAAGCKYSKAKKAWHWHHEEEDAKWYRGKTTMDEIRTKYGSEKMRFDRQPELAQA